MSSGSVIATVSFVVTTAGYDFGPSVGDDIMRFVHDQGWVMRDCVGSFRSGCDSRESELEDWCGEVQKLDGMEE